MKVAVGNLVVLAAFELDLGTANLWGGKSAGTFLAIAKKYLLVGQLPPDGKKRTADNGRNWKLFGLEGNAAVLHCPGHVVSFAD